MSYPNPYLDVTVFERDFSNLVPTANLQWRVEKYSKSVLGGPLYATLRVTGEEAGLWDLLDYLRRPVQIRTGIGELVWWGFVQNVSLVVNTLELLVDLDTVRNRLEVAYNAIIPVQTAYGQRTTTGWLNDAGSEAKYGRKEELLSLGEATPSAADTYLRMMLKEQAWPSVTVVTGGGEAFQRKAVVNCRGWYTTLGWRRYANTSYASTVTTTQVQTMVLSSEFIPQCRVVNASGLSLAAFKDGENTIKHYVEELLRFGTSNQRRLLINVTPERTAEVYEEPQLVQADAYWLTQAGELLDPAQMPVGKYLCPVGYWVRLKDVVQPGLSQQNAAYVPPFFVDEAEYSPEQNRLTLRPRGARSPWDLGAVQQQHWF